jgi:hypothetical protein
MPVVGLPIIESCKNIFMRTSLRLLAGAALLLFCISCQKEISYDTAALSGNATGVNGVVKMKINGVQWTADKVAGASLMNGIINITGVGKDKKYFTISLTDTITGTYHLSDTAAHAAAYLDSSQLNKGTYTTNASENINLAGGTVIISAIDKVHKTISGTFQLKLFRQSDSGTVTITEGVFDKLGYATTLSLANGTDTVNAKVDGSLWQAKTINTLNYGGYIIINASAPDLSRSLSIQVTDHVNAGTYNLTFFGDYISTYAPNNSTAYMADSGKVTIVERNLITKRIRGTFNFRASTVQGTGTSYSITEGYFSVKTP